MTKPKPLPASAFVDDEVFDEVDVSMPPLRAPRPVSARPDSIPDLSKLARTWMLIGRGGSGKTMLARWLGGHLAERGLLDRSLLAALDPTNRSLAAFFDGVRQPGTRQGSDAADFLVRMVAHTTRRQMSGIWDFGGGDLSLASLVETDPKFDLTMEADGCAVVAAYVLSPAVDDLAMLRSFEAAGFQPRATALILNLGMADNPASFGALRAQAIYKATLARGAVEIFMPKLHPEAIALEVERKRLHFFQARDSVVPEGSRVEPMAGLNSMMVRHFLHQMDEAFDPVSTWLPWT